MGTGAAIDGSNRKNRLPADATFFGQFFGHHNSLINRALSPIIGVGRPCGNDKGKRIVNVSVDVVISFYCALK